MKISRFISTGLFALALTIFTPAASAMSIIPMETLLLNADIVVIGDIVKHKEGFEKDGKTYMLAEIEVVEVMKGDDKELKTVDVAFEKIEEKPAPVQNVQGPNGLQIQVRPHIVHFNPAKQFEIGKTAVFALKKIPDQNAYKTHNLRYGIYSLQQADQIEAKLKFLDSLKWSKPVNGLAGLFWAEPSQQYDHKTRSNKPTAMLKVYLKNVTDQPLRVPMDFRLKPIHGTVKIDGHQPVKLETYPQLNNKKAIQLTRHAYRVIQPGEAISFNMGNQNLYKPTGSGVYLINATFVNQLDGKGEDRQGKFELENVWTGELPLRPYSVAVGDLTPKDGAVRILPHGPIPPDVNTFPIERKVDTFPIER